jgi:hypothetical protein
MATSALSAWARGASTPLIPDRYRAGGGPAPAGRTVTARRLDRPATSPEEQLMHAQALTVPVTRISVPALLLAAAGTAAAVALAVLVVDERTVVVSPPQGTAPAVVDEPQTPGDAYAEQLELRRRAYLDSLRDD